MQRLHEMLSANRYPNCRKIAAEFEVSTKTIQRDVNFMRDRLRLPIEYDGRHTGFRYSRPVDDPPIAFASEIAKAKKSAPAKEVATDFSLLDRTRRSGAKGGGEAVARIWFDPQVAAAVQVLASHPFQGAKILPDGGIELKVQLDGVVDIDRWVLSWGPYARVLEPVSLRRRILKIARMIIASYFDR
jgi:predicted DNA-binding transcriptional regulator YafY